MPMFYVIAAILALSQSRVRTKPSLATCIHWSAVSSLYISHLFTSVLTKWSPWILHAVLATLGRLTLTSAPSLAQLTPSSELKSQLVSHHILPVVVC